MMNKDDVLSRLRELKPTLYRDFAVKEIGLFGSFSDNTHNEDSDIDSYSDSGFYDNPLYDSDDDW